MTYVIAQACTDIKDKRCIEQCPVDCIYEGARAVYINPEECIECGACEPVCPVEAVYYDADLPDEYAASLDSNRAFFTEPLMGRTDALGNPGGFKRVGPIQVDSKFVTSLPSKS